jgi:hypothetical protein
MKDQFVGAWSLVSYEVRSPSGEVSYPYGKDFTGRISYDAEGHMTAQMMRRDLPKFSSDVQANATPDEMATAWRGYIGYFGTYTIDEKAGAVIHHIDGSWFPNQAGTSLTRYFKFQGNHLILEAVLPVGRATIVWERSRR